MEVRVKKTHVFHRDALLNAQIAIVLMSPASNQSLIVSLVSIISLLREIPALSLKKATLLSEGDVKPVTQIV